LKILIDENEIKLKMSETNLQGVKKHVDNLSCK